MTKWYERRIKIDEDIRPNAKFKVINKGHRNIGSENFGNIEIKCVSDFANEDDEVKVNYSVIYDYNGDGIYDESAICYDNDFVAVYNGKQLGNYKIEKTAIDNIQQLPNEDHELYNEIKEKVKSNKFVISNVFIDNLRPTITFNYNDEENIKLFVQYDFVPTKKDRDIMNELIYKLKKNGVSVELVEDIY